MWFRFLLKSAKSRSAVAPVCRSPRRPAALRLRVEALEDRSVPSTVAYGDFNKDGLMDMAAITSPTTITVSLANPDGSYSVSATLTVPKNRPLLNVSVGDPNADGNLNISDWSLSGNNSYIDGWLGHGDGTFGSLVTTRWNPPKAGF